MRDPSAGVGVAAGDRAAAAVGRLWQPGAQGLDPCTFSCVHPSAMLSARGWVLEGVENMMVPHYPQGPGTPRMVRLGLQVQVRQGPHANRAYYSISQSQVQSCLQVGSKYARAPMQIERAVRKQSRAHILYGVWYLLCKHRIRTQPHLL